MRSFRLVLVALWILTGVGIAAPAEASDAWLHFSSSSRYVGALENRSSYTLEVRFGESDWQAIAPKKSLQIDRRLARREDQWSVRYTKSAWKDRNEELLARLAQSLPSSVDRSQLRAFMDSPSRPAMLPTVRELVQQSFAEEDRAWERRLPQLRIEATREFGEALAGLGAMCNLIRLFTPDERTLYCRGDQCWVEGNLISPLMEGLGELMCTAEMHKLRQRRDSRLRKPDFHGRTSSALERVERFHQDLEENDVLLQASNAGGVESFEGLFRRRLTADLEYSKKRTTAAATLGWGFGLFRTLTGSNWVRGGSAITQQVRLGVSPHPEIRLDSSRARFLRLFVAGGWERVAVRPRSDAEDDQVDNLLYDMVALGADVRYIDSGFFVGGGAGVQTPFAVLLKRREESTQRDVAEFDSGALHPFWQGSVGVANPSSGFLELSLRGYALPAISPGPQYALQGPDGAALPLPPSGNVLDLRVTVGVAL